MIQPVKKMAQPWDFTLYAANDGSILLKVMFIEGEYKCDVGRYFIIGEAPEDAAKSLEEVKLLANKIRSSYPLVLYREVKKSDLTILK